MGEEDIHRQPPPEPDADDGVDELSRRHVQFRMENTVLSDHLTRLITRKGTDHFHLQLEALEEDIRQTEEESEARRTSRSSLRVPAEDGIESIGRDSRLGSLRRSSQRGSLKARPISPPELYLPLSMEEKSEIAEDECAAVKLHTLRYRDESERVLDDLKAVIEETELSIGEIKKETNSFRREKKFKELLDIGTQESDGPSPPHALEYMQLKESAQRLQKEVERWKKKVEIAELTASQLERHLKNRASDDKNRIESA